jgi:hypothetical protein
MDVQVDHTAQGERLAKAQLGSPHADVDGFHEGDPVICLEHDGPGDLMPWVPPLLDASWFDH